VVTERLFDGRGESLGAVVVEQAQECRGGGSQRQPSLGQTLQQLLAPWSRAPETIEPPMLLGPSFVIDKLLDMLGVLDLLAAIEGSGMARHDLVAVEDAYL